jgi:hypothetical protein
VKRGFSRLPLVSAQAFTSKQFAEANAAVWRSSPAKRREYHARVIGRRVRAGGADVEVWVTVVRKREQPATPASAGEAVPA